MTMVTASDIGKRPISDNAPAGSEVRDTPEFDRVQSEIAKLSTLSGSAVVDWREVAALCETILTRQGKDLLVACYLAGALLESEGVPGLARGLSIIADLLATYWETLFPPLKRLRARRSALQWLSDRIGQKAGDSSWQQPVDGEVIDGLAQSLRDIDALLRERDDEAPSMRPVLALLGGLSRIDEAHATVVDAVPDSSVTPASSPPPASSTPPVTPQAAAVAANAPQTSSVAPPAVALPVQDGLAAEKALALLGERVGELAQWYQGIDLENPVSYRLKRIAVWSPIDAVPPEQNGKTFVAGPQAQTVAIMKRLEAAGSPDEVLRFCENQLLVQPFWLDVNRAAAKSLGLCGSRFAPAREAVEDETARLVARLPRLPDLAFSNGQAFADEATRRWIATLGGAAAAAPVVDDEQVIDEARTLAATGQSRVAADLMQREIALAGSAQRRYVLRLRLCEMLAGHAAPGALGALVRGLLDDIDRFRIDEWQPGLALDGLLAGYRLLRQDGERRDEAARLLARIARLDAAGALDLADTLSPGKNSG